MITGKIVGRGIAASEYGQHILGYRMVKPDKSVSNLEEMGKESQRWRRSAEALRERVKRGEVSMAVVKRAEFVDEVLALTAEYVRAGGDTVVVAQADDSRILGVVAYRRGDGTKGHLNLLALDPEHIPGTPDGKHLRGVGTSLVAVAAQDLRSQGVDTIFIKPFDEAAALFWKGRGFHVCGAGGLMCVRGEGEIAALLGVCQVRPDFPNGGDFVVCGWPRDTIGARVPHR